MRLVLQRVSSAAVRVNGGEPQKTGHGLAILAGFNAFDDEKTAVYMAEKAANLRVFSDENGAMNLSLLDIKGECLCVSNFTLYADCKKGRRPSFTNAAPPQASEPVYELFVRALKNAGVRNVVTGEFGAEMLVDIQNDGPVTVILDSAEIMPKTIHN
jgi:D-tyrosyl-tRNA(Tyr) deacylase